VKKALIALLVHLISANAVFAAEQLPALKIEQLADGVYLHTSYQIVEGFGLVDSNGLLVLHNKDAYIVDTPWSATDTDKLVQWAKKRGNTVKASISTHFHEDRTAGIALLNSRSIPTYASEQTNALLRKAGRAEARNTFKGPSFWLVPDVLEVFYPGPGHSPDNVVVWLPRQKILSGGCLVRAKETNTLGNTGDAVISAWSGSVEKLESRYSNARLVVPGHGKVGDVLLLKHTRELVAQ
jgi:glyoxylase-like metal-dependent hydrolase (beta-lactamase superfamily II)